MVWRDAGNVAVYDRLCDHAGGRLVSTRDRVICPMHGWGFDPRTGRYDNGRVRKRPLPIVDEGGVWRIQIETRVPDLAGSDQDLPVAVRFLNHACLLVEGGEVRFATDPWLFGSAFCDGWWLAMDSPADAIDAVNGCDFLFISHNHPDHLHPETLRRLRPDMLILTPGFQSGSTERYLRDLGFRNVMPLQFGQAYRHAELTLTALKSGDFRDDSGLYFRIGAFSAVFTVDANFLNFGALPHATLLATSFAGGASGFPLCFDDYSPDEKRRLIARNRAAARAIATTYVETVRPKVYMPYAGFFAEDRNRDRYIADHNVKNRVLDYTDPCSRVGAVLMDVQATPMARFMGDALEGLDTVDVDAAPPTDRDAVIGASRAAWQAITDDEVAAYFAASGYQGELILNLSLTEDHFEPGADSFEIDFRVSPPTIRRIETLPNAATLNAATGAQVTNARVRRPAFVRTLREGLPWEDMSIGFQARFERAPNVYEADFWFHFTNVHISDCARRATVDCGQACRKLEATLV